jgi:hypothetical protein
VINESLLIVDLRTEIESAPRTNPGTQSPNQQSAIIDESLIKDPQINNRRIHTAATAFG